MCNKKWVTAILLSVTIFLFSCQAGKEIHFFKTGGNYYRLRVIEKSFASKARYLSGFYDEKAVDKYFGEMSQPKEGTPSNASDVIFIKPIEGKDGKDNFKIDSSRQLVLILSTNSTAVSEQIGAFAENEQILESIARLSNKEKIAESDNYVKQVSDSKQRSASVIASGDGFINSLAETDDNVKVRSNLKSFLINLKAMNTGTTNVTAIELLINQLQKK
jgi:hypothetical protein